MILNQVRRYTFGIDGGGTRCRGRIRDQHGNIIAEGEAGPANVHINFLDSIRTIRSLIDKLGQESNIFPLIYQEMSLGLGLAGILASGDEARVAREFSDFGDVHVASDAVTACIGAHENCDGGLVIAGTGSAGLARVKGKNIGIGGRGFALGDDGSGARIGWDALRQALLAADGIRQHTQLTHKLMAKFDNDPLAVTRWSATAKSSDYAALTPIIFSLAEKGDSVALPIIKNAGRAITDLAHAISRQGVTRIALVGGMAVAILPYVLTSSEFLMVDPANDATDGAIIMAGGVISRKENQE